MYTVHTCTISVWYMYMYVQYTCILYIHVQFLYGTCTCMYSIHVLDKIYTFTCTCAHALTDNELPDYIMVMLVNKKTFLQINNDLQLFLGDHTNPFTEWLQQALGSPAQLGSSRKSEDKSTMYRCMLATKYH